jgi:membrane protease YdiL (CAAX protease family)
MQSKPNPNNRIKQNFSHFRRDSIPREITSVFIISLIFIGLIILLGQWIPFVSENALGFVALLFLYLPTVFLRKKGLDSRDYGLDLNEPIRGLITGILITCLTLPGFLIGFHLWETRVLHHESTPSWDNYFSWPESLRIADDAPILDEPLANGIWLRRLQRSIWLKWAENDVGTLTVESDSLLTYRGGQVPVIDLESDDQSRWRFDTSPSGGTVVFWAQEGSYLKLSSTPSAVSQTNRHIDVPGGEIDPETGGIIIRRQIWWLPFALLVQLLLVALPEEFFYRGYLQGRIDDLTPIRWNLGPFHTSPAILITSTLFALSHFLSGFNPLRLSVFFPSLVFGWLKDRSEGLVAPIVYHAACNLMVQLAVIHYWPRG